MRKTIYIPKGQTYEFDELSCERIVVNGELKITGTLTAKHIHGNGIISANEIKCISLVSGFVTAGKIIANELMAKQVSAVAVHAASSLSVSTYIEAGYVKTPKAIIAEAEIEDMHATDICKLSPKARSLWTMLIIFQLRSWWVELVHSGKKLMDDAAKKTSPGTAGQSDTPDITEAAEMLKDPDFLKLVRFYNAFKNGNVVFPPEEPASAEPERAHQFTVVKDSAAQNAA